jgi:hypothetical protein
MTWIICAFVWGSPDDLRSNFVESCAERITGQDVSLFYTQRVRCAAIASRMDWSRQ